MTGHPKPADPDEALVKACQNIDCEVFDDAFEALYERYKDRVYSIAYRITGTASDAMDVVQDTFGALFRRIGSFQFQSLFSTWLFRIVVNASIDHRRREQTRIAPKASIDKLEEPSEPSDPASGPAGSAETGELEDHVHVCLQKISPKLRAVLVLRYVESLSYEQVADTLEVSLGTVKSRLARAHLAIERVLRDTLAPFGFDELAAETGDVA